MFHIAIDREYLKKELGLDPDDEPEYYDVVAMDGRRSLTYIIFIRPGDRNAVVIPSEHVTEVWGFVSFKSLRKEAIRQGLIT